MDRDLIVLLHTITGVLVLCSGSAQILLRKGGRSHRITGRIYLGAWIIILITGAYLGSLLITILGIFGFYFGLSGGRIAALKNEPPHLFDKMVMLAVLLLSIVMLVYSIILYSNGDLSFGIIFTVFGFIFLFATLRDVRKYVMNSETSEGKYGRSGWFFEHFIRMYISFIAAVTAFSSIQNLFGENTLNFLMPTLIGIVLIRISRKKYESKMKVGLAE